MQRKSFIYSFSNNHLQPSRTYVKQLAYTNLKAAKIELQRHKLLNINLNGYRFNMKWEILSVDALQNS